MKRFVILACGLLAAASANAQDPSDKQKSELEWAKGVATDFLKAAKATDSRQARQLLTPELAKQYTMDEIGPPSPLGSGGTIEKWEFAKEKLAPDKDEAVLDGAVFGRNSDTEYSSAFTIRVVKHKESGRWRIDFFVFETCQKKVSKKGARDAGKAEDTDLKRLSRADLEKLEGVWELKLTTKKGEDPLFGPAERESNVTRGGCSLRGPLDCRSANRFGLSGATRQWVGFRVVAEHGKVKPERIEPKKVEAEKYSLSVDFVTKKSEPVKVVKEWVGQFPKKHVKLVPREAKQYVGVIVDAKTFEAVWTAWSDASEGTLPNVDFDKHFVLFRIRDADVFYPALVDFTIQDGVLKFKIGSSQVPPLPPRDVDKITAVMVVLPRQGIRSFDTGNGVFELPGHPEPKAKETSADVEKVYRQYLKAAINQDKKALERLLAEDYSLIDDKGRLGNRAHLVERLTSARNKITSIDTTNLKVRVYGKAAVVTTHCTEKGTASGLEFNERFLYTVVLVNQDGRWLIVAEHATTARD